MIQHYLEEQQRLTAVERFSQLHEADALPAQARYYRSLLPAKEPAPGQQYAFSVDLDRCTGCKACVTACHNLNGLDDGETWRAVGLLHGGSASEPVQQTVTTACHHCVDPGCMNGCPANAYEKDARTGIVRHLDDQCIGCQYCTLMCPYDVPQFNRRLGIVRKCDMCSERLGAGEAPACVQACPNEAIAIRVVDADQVREDAQASTFLPGAPAPGITLPSTEYKTRRVLPKNTLPADFYRIEPAHNHLPLVLMLVLTQLSLGAFALDYALSFFVDLGALRRPLTLFALGAGLLGLVAATFHLGRPLYAFRALVGLRHSWMSREVLCFGLFTKLAVAYAALPWAEPLLGWLGLEPLAPDTARALERGLGAGVVLSGALGLACSALLYAATRRTWWKLSLSASRFLGTTLVLGLGLASWLSAALGASASLLVGLNLALAASSAVKLLGEASLLLHARDVQVSDMKRSALLMRGPLFALTALRLATGTVGGVVVPALLTARLGAAGSEALRGPMLALVALSAVCLVVGELCERSLFFMAAAPPKMPGAVGR